MKLPVIIMLALVPLVLTAYAEAPSHVDVYDYPFNITLLEGGNFTLYNNGTNTISFSGSFPGTVEVDSQETFELPVYYFNAPNTYYLRDMSLPDTYMSTVTLVKPTPVYVPPTPSFNSTSNGTSGTFEPIVQPTAPKVVLEELPCGVKEKGEVTTYDCKVTFDNGVAKAKVMFYNDDLKPYLNYETVGYFVNNGVQGKIINMNIDRIEAHEYKQVIFLDESMNGVSEFVLQLGETKPITNNIVTPEPTPVTTTESSDTEVLNLRLQILKVIESIFKIVLQ
jgi:hypothetical protein